MKLATFLTSSTGLVFTKLLGISESSIIITVRLHWALFLILLSSAVICKQRLLHGIEIVQYLKNCKCYNVGQDHLRKPLKDSTRFLKISYL